MGGPKKLQPQIPPDLIKAYSTHGKFGRDFMNVMKNFNEEWGIPEPTANVEPDTVTPRKKAEKRLGSDHGSPGPDKKQKLDPSCTIDSALLDDELRHECALSAFKGGNATLQIRSKTLCIVNKGMAEAVAPRFAWLCGMPRGTFKLLKEDHLACELSCQPVT